MQIKYSQGDLLREIADELAIKYDTLQKAVKQNRIKLIAPAPEAVNSHVQTKSDRTVIDDNTGMGKACSNDMERILASVAEGAPATIKFNEQTDLSCAGVLLSLPALLSNGLLTHSQDFKLEKVYYSEEMIFLCLAFLSLLRVKNINQANTIPCGELGRALGLDRIPEVKTLRKRIARFTAKGNGGDRDSEGEERDRNEYNADTTYMTGWFIAEKVESDGKNVVWSKNSCNMLQTRNVLSQPFTNQPATGSHFDIKVLPNPSATNFRLLVETYSKESVQIRLLDATGRVLGLYSNVSPHSIIIVGDKLNKGIYFADILQGKQRKIVKLVKL